MGRVSTLLVGYLGFLLLLVACAVTETGTPGADPSEVLEPGVLRSMRVENDPGSRYVAVAVDVPREGALEGLSHASWVLLDGADPFDVYASETMFQSVVSFLPAAPDLRFSAWSDGGEKVLIADLRYDFDQATFVPSSPPCLRWSQRALQIVGETATVGIDNTCETEQSASYGQVLRSVMTQTQITLAPGERWLVDLAAGAGDETGRAVWQLSPGGALLDVFEAP